tara:strand:+ start:3192 stop:5834 length:2643 start_codon:yes stop_codon:yes gene_type:complete
MDDNQDFLSKKYSPKEIEHKWLDDVTSETTFQDNDSNPFSIAIPPPNVTGNLHLGHALNTTIQDILIKFNNLNGNDTLWSLGTDHAGIATQLLVEKSLSKKGINPKEIQRDELLNHIWNWKEENGQDILNQLKVLGLSCNWSNPKFTLDDDLSNSVQEAFVCLFDKGLIYQEKTLINWDKKLQTAISDLEVVSERRKSTLYYFKYFIDNSDSEIIVSTTRPETVFGDVAVVVNPKDERYLNFIGKKIKSPFNDNLLEIIADDYADMSKGSGAVKITPAHDFNDYEIGKKYNLPMINILNDDGTLNESVPSKFQKLSVEEARERVVLYMEEIGILIKNEEIKNNVPIGDRSGQVIEPLLKNQWFLNVKEMASKSIDAVKTEKVQFKPKFWENTFFEWMNNIQPWCISRQIIWGHRIPVWHSSDGRFVAAKDIETANKKFFDKFNEEAELHQDKDVLDTWFSSSLWPFSTLGWPKKTDDYKKYFPTSLLVTGFDIIFFWVARMIMMSIELTGQIPFKVVYIHNLIRDKKGQKMSKTKGNVVDPLDLISEYGTDALRFYLSSNISPHSDIKLGPNSLEPYKNFMNKIWNAGKFIGLNNKSEKNIKLSKDTFYDAWIIDRFNLLLDKYKNHIKNCEIEKASYEIYHFFWDDFCDWYIEIAKISYNQNSSNQSLNTKARMQELFVSFLNVLYPFAPFISNELNQNLSANKDEINFRSFPNKIKTNYEGNFVDELKLLKDFTIGIRSLRKNLMIKPSKKIVCYYNLNVEEYSSVPYIKDIIKELCNLESLLDVRDIRIDGKLISNHTNSGTLSILRDNDIDFSQQISKLSKDMKLLEKASTLSKSKLSNKGFLDSAPEEIIKEEEDKLNEALNSIKEIENLISQLN